MKRKIVKNGTATLTVSLPSKWAKRFNLNAGDELDVDEKGSRLTIEAKKQTSNAKKIINVKGLNSSTLTMYFHSAYRAGYDEIELHLHDSSIPVKGKHAISRKLKSSDRVNTLKFVNEFTNFYIGLEVFHQDEGKVILKDIGATTNVDLPIVFHRIQEMVRKAGELFLKALESKNEEDAYNMLAVEHNINKFCNYYLRQLNKKHYPSIEQDISMYMLISFIEGATDVYWDILRLVVLQKHKLDMKTYEYCSNGVRLLNESISRIHFNKKEDFTQFYLQILSFVVELRTLKNMNQPLSELKVFMKFLRDIAEYLTMRP